VDCGVVGVEHDLRLTRTVAKINKNQSSEIAATVNPTHERDGFSGVGGAKLAAPMCALQSS
jgi:hypothetical protein